MPPGSYRQTEISPHCNLFRKEETEEEEKEEEEAEEEEGDGSGQNKDERLFSLIGRNTGPQSRNIKIETIEKQGRHSANSCEKA